MELNLTSLKLVLLPCYVELSHRFYLYKDEYKLDECVDVYANLMLIELYDGQNTVVIRIKRIFLFDSEILVLYHHPTESAN